MTTPSERVFIAHHNSSLGSALLRMGHSEMSTPVEVLTAPPSAIDWSCSVSIRDFLRHARPTSVVLPVAEQVGGASGIETVLKQCLVGGVNLIEQAQRTGIKRLLVVGGDCAYPGQVPGPFAEEDVLTGRFDPACETLGLATLALIKMCERYTLAFGQQQELSYRSLLTATPFGPDMVATATGPDVITDVLERLHDALEQQVQYVELPYTQEQRREFLYADDVAQAAMYVLKIDNTVYASATAPSRRLLNAGYGAACSMGALVHTLAGLVGYTGQLAFDESQEDNLQGTRALDSNRLRSLGWRPSLAMEDALALTYFHTLALRRKQRENGSS